MYVTVLHYTVQDVFRIPTAVLLVPVSVQLDRMNESMTLLIRYVHLYISFWNRNVYVERLLSATSCLDTYVIISVFRHLLSKP